MKVYKVIIENFELGTSQLWNEVVVSGSIVFVIMGDNGINVNLRQKIQEKVENIGKYREKDEEFHIDSRAATLL